MSQCCFDKNKNPQKRDKIYTFESLGRVKDMQKRCFFQKCCIDVNLRIIIVLGSSLSDSNGRRCPIAVEYRILRTVYPQEQMEPFSRNWKPVWPVSFRLILRIQGVNIRGNHLPEGCGGEMFGVHPSVSRSFARIIGFCRIGAHSHGSIHHHQRKWKNVSFVNLLPYFVHIIFSRIKQ